MMNRREALARIGGLMAGGWLTSLAAAKDATSSSLVTTGTANITPPVAGTPVTLAHITDIHIMAERNAPRWFAECLHSIQSHAKKPTMIINTGDCVIDSLKADRQRADDLWKIFNDTLKSDLSLPIHHALGNHDVWALRRKATDPAKKDPLYGKKLALEKLGMENSYNSFDYGDWHFILLDCIQPEPTMPSGWFTKINKKQFEWLKTDLESIDPSRPVAVYSHVPIIQACSFLSMKPGKDNSYSISSHGMFSDARQVIDLFMKHPNVKLCYSGHLHRRDRIEVGGTTYICDGAVCGSWWKGPRLYSPPGYSVTTFNPDGTFDHQYDDYGWKETPASKA